MDLTSSLTRPIETVHPSSLCETHNNLSRASIVAIMETCPSHQLWAVCGAVSATLVSATLVRLIQVRAGIDKAPRFAPHVAKLITVVPVSASKTRRAGRIDVQPSSLSRMVVQTCYQISLDTRGVLRWAKVSKVWEIWDA